MERKEHELKCDAGYLFAPFEAVPDRDNTLVFVLNEKSYCVNRKQLRRLWELPEESSLGWRTRAGCPDRLPVKIEQCSGWLFQLPFATPSGEPVYIDEGTKELALDPEVHLIILTDEKVVGERLKSRVPPGRIRHFYAVDKFQ
jgi:hypothetical protein